MLDAILEIFTLIWTWIVGLFTGGGSESSPDDPRDVVTSNGRLTSYARSLYHKLANPVDRLRASGVTSSDLTSIRVDSIGGGDPQWDGLRVALSDTVSKSSGVLGDASVELPKTEISRDRYRPSEETVVVLRAFYSGVKLSVSVAGTVVTLGSAGDTIPDLIFLAVDSSILAAELATMLATDDTYSRDLYAIQWNSGGVDAVETQAKGIINRAKCDGAFRALCDSYRRVIGWIASQFGSMLSTMIPDDAGTTRFIIETLVAIAAAFQYETLAYASTKLIYRSLPPNIRAILEDPVRMREFFTAVIDMATDLIPNRNDTVLDVARKNATRYAVGAVFSVGALASFLVPPVAAFAVPANAALVWSNVLLSSRTLGQKTIDFIEASVKPHLDSLVELCQKIMALMFTALCLLESCNEGCTDGDVSRVGSTGGVPMASSASIVDSV